MSKLKTMLNGKYSRLLSQCLIALCGGIIILLSCKVYAKTNFETQVTGIKEPLLTNVMNQLNSQLENSVDNLDAENARRLYQAGSEHIRLALRPFGYFSSKISSELHYENHKWIATYQITPGIPARISKVDLRITGPGANEKRFRRFLTHHLRLHPGQVLSLENYNATKQTLFNIANRIGYIKAHMLRNEVQIDVEHNTASIILYFDTGPLYYFGSFIFNQSTYDEKFLRRFLFIKPGEPYSANKLIKLQQDFTNSNYFQQVSITPLQDQAKNNQIPITVNLIPNKSQQYLLGLGYGTDTRIRGTLGMNFRRVTASGQQFKALVQASQVQNSFETRYIIPGNNPITEQYAIGANVINNSPPNAFTRTEKLSVAYISHQKVWQRSIGLTFQHDNYTNAPVHGVNTFYPSISWLYLKTNDPLRTLNGSRVNLTLSGGLRGALSDLTFAQLVSNAKFIHSFFNGNRVLVTGNFNYTATPGLSNINNLPLSMRFYAGGTNSLRGYTYQAIGPGKLLVTGSVELQQQIVGNWYLGAFYDTGNAYDNFAKLKRSVGGAVIWLTPIGALELSIAKPLDDPNNSHPRVQFSMGPDL